MKLRPFELGLVIVFAVMALMALAIINLYKPAPDDGDLLAAQIGKVDIWGTIPAEHMNSVLFDLREENEAYMGVSYKYYPPAEFNSRLVNALADETGPDLILLSQEKLAEMRKRIQPFSYESFPVPDIRNLYVDGAQIFALSDGLYGFPIAVDPLVMYWNRDIFTTEGHLSAPQTWEELVNGVFPDLIERDFDRTIRRSVVAMGEYANVRNAFGIISTLLIQGGSQMVLEGKTAAQYVVNLHVAPKEDDNPLMAAADFYTRFSKPSNALYSWNRSLPEDRQVFISEDLAIYFGFASEAREIERLNPNLNFDIAEVPQGETATNRRTYGRIYTLSLLKASDNKGGASALLQALGSATVSNKIAQISGMAPARRASIVAGSNDKYGRVAYSSASIALGWLNPRYEEADSAFDIMTRDINENRRDISGAISDITERLQDAY